ncbi:MAG: AAA family ATPase [Polyangiaceae bacterium]|nr:AAA family ATPase [Polyangiaceae bacterium]
MKFVPAIGQSDFRPLREAGQGYVDKTEFIAQVLADPSLVLLFPRPRRFGKTINISALGYFLRKTDENLSHLFEGLAVTRDPKAMAHFQKYPTLFVTFKDVKAKTFAETLVEIGKQIERLCREHRYVIDGKPLDTGRAHRLERLLSGTASKTDLESSLLDLMEVLQEHHGERIVILIDEYDTPIQSGYVNGFFDDIVLFFRNFLSAALKDNSALFKGVLTGILRVSKENMFSGLNNIDVHSIMSPTYATSFGFTEEEVASIVDPQHLEEVRSWYNGYVFGGQVIYNPWSILNYVKKGILGPYWINTSSHDLIERLATRQGMGLSAMSAALLHGETIEVPLDDNIVLRDIDQRPDALWNFLLFSGYLKLAKLVFHEGRYTGVLCIPNKEIQIVYENMFRNWLRRAVPDRSMLDELVQALLDGETSTVEAFLQQILLTVLSYQDGAGREPEKLYHGLVLGLLVHLESHYAVRSNRESGYGRADVLMIPKTTGRPGVVMELKVPFGNETPEQALQKAAKQVRNRKYAAELENAGATPVHEYAMAFDGKRVWVKRVEDCLGA